MDGDYVNKLDVDDYCHGPSYEAGLSIVMTYQCLSADNIELDDHIGPSLLRNCKTMMQHFGKGQISMAANRFPSFGFDYHINHISIFSTLCPSKFPPFPFLYPHVCIKINEHGYSQ